MRLPRIGLGRAITSAFCLGTARPKPHSDLPTKPPRLRSLKRIGRSIGRGVGGRLRLRDFYALALHEGEGIDGSINPPRTGVWPSSLASAVAEFPTHCLVPIPDAPKHGA